MKIIECPRDAMQGIKPFIPTEKKIAYINQLLKVGFHTIDFGSFVSPKAVPQMRDTAEVLRGLDLENARSSLLAIVANVRGARDAAAFQAIDYIGFPLSISETFQQKNTNKSIAQSVEDLSEIHEICAAHGKALGVYISMGFGNPYGDPWDVETVINYVQKLYELDIKTISLADTVGMATEERVEHLFSHLIPAYPDVEFGAHLHVRPDRATQMLDAAYRAGCVRFDGALQGYGGCPMAEDELVGNMPTETMVEYFSGKGEDLGLNQDALEEALRLAGQTFPLKNTGTF